MHGRGIDARLAEQNNGEAWRDCELAGLRHRLKLVQEVTSERPELDPVIAEYYACTRPSCPTTIRRTR